jgi:hypothetical protein
MELSGKSLPENLIGMVAICSKGRIGIIKRKCNRKGKCCWEGIGYYDKKEWQSSNPFPIALTIEDFEGYKKNWTDFVKNYYNNQGENKNG